MSLVALLILVGVLAPVLGPGGGLPQAFSARTPRSVAPAPAGAFYDSVGVDVHVTYGDTAYGDWPRLVGALDELGVRHLRDGFGNPDPSWGWFNNNFQNAVELAASHGMHFVLTMGQPGYRGGTIPDLVSVLSGRLRNAVEALEEPNEFDQSSGLSAWFGLERLGVAVGGL